MKQAKQAVKYYTVVTGNPWSKFYDDLDEALSGNLEEQTGDMWLIHALMNTIIKSGISLNEFKTNKDMVKAEFDEAGRKRNGEFFTPVIWAEEAHRYLDKHIPGWRKSYNVWEPSCYDIKVRVYIRRHCEDRTGLTSLYTRYRDDYYLRSDWVILSDEDTTLFAHSEWRYETGYTFIGSVYPGMLRDGDEILTHRDDGSLEWCGFHNLFFRDEDELKMLRFTIEAKNRDANGVLRVTEDHRMYVYDVVNDSYTFKTAIELFSNFSKFRIVDCYGVQHIILSCLQYSEQEACVWDLTTNNDTHNFLVTTPDGMRVFSGNCGSGNLIRTAGITPGNLFASTLQEDDVTLIRNTKELSGCHAFQLDFLSAIDDGLNNEFLETLPEELQDVILNDKPLLIFANPPYKTGMARATEVGRYMQSTRDMPDYNFTDFSKPAYDVFYQFCFQIMNMVSRFNLSNTYYCFFGPLTFFTGAGANILLKQFEHCFEFVDGMCISAQEFSDTSEAILWGIGCSVWKARGGYIDGENMHKDILLDKKFLTPDGKIGCEGKVLYEPPRQKLSDWVVPKDGDTYGRVAAPLMTSHLTFKGSDVFEKVAPKSGLLGRNALGTLMVGNTLTRSADQSAVLSMPTTIQYVDITEENFWRCVASYAFRRTIDAGWAIAKKEISAPNPEVEGYDVWLRNAIVSFLFEYKSMMSSIRGIEWGGYKEYWFPNKLFYLTEAEILEYCHDEVILKDLEEHPLQNEFMLRMIEESKPYWVPEIKQLYDWCKTYTLATYDFRKTVNYKGSLECADAGFQQLRAGLWNAEKLDNDLTKLLTQARSYLRKDLWKFGFVSEVIDKSEI